MIEKVSIILLGTGEYVLRFFPFLCGVISLFLFRRTAARYIYPKAVVIALGLFAVSDTLIYYSSEVKQYMSDVFFALALYVLLIFIQSKKITLWRSIFFGISGAVAFWFSYSALFVLAGIGTVEIVSSLFKKEYQRLCFYMLICLIWTAGFIIYYYFSLALSHDTALTDFFINYWSGGFMPFPPLAFSDLKWIIEKFFEVFKDPGGLFLSGIAALTFLTGCISMLSEKKKDFFTLISPIFFVLAASALRKYPFEGRLLLFIVPLLFLFIAHGAEKIRSAVCRTYPVIGTGVIVLLFLYPLASAGYHFLKPRVNEEIKPVLNCIREDWRQGDFLYVYYASHPAFEYYSKKYGFTKNDYIRHGITSRDNWNKYAQDLENLRGRKRAWVLFSHVHKSTGIDEEKLFLWYLDKTGTMLKSFKAAGAAAYLYDLSGP